jgi:predicted peptidase
MKKPILLTQIFAGNVAKKLFTLLIGVICICQAFAQPRQWSTVVYNGTREAWVYLPPGYNSKNEWPVIIFLHGAGERGTDPNDLLVTGLPEYLNNGNDLEAIVICPQIPTTLGAIPIYVRITVGRVVQIRV